MAINRMILQGNLCRDIELLQTNNGGTYLKNSIACQRNYSKEGEEKQSDFVNVLAYGKTAEFIQKYFTKGSQILVEGRIQTGSYSKDDGTKVYTTDLVIEHVYFCGSKSQQNNDSNGNLEEFMQNSGVEFNTAKGNDLPF